MDKPGNRLRDETSPYLRQHESNPVDWYTWGPEALELAKRENKPILLSIGYSACHWCHVMAHESFENPETAALMNENFVNIKVDREERPDLDQIYQNVAQAMTQGGGWPLTVFLLPDQRPFFGGTYFPPEDRWGRPGFPRVLRSLADAFRDDPNGIGENATQLTNIIAELEKNQRIAVKETTDAPAEVLRRAEEAMLQGFDYSNGGFGDAPKFPSTMMLSFVFRMGSDAGVAAALLALTKMASGGIFDQIGGGFHRYSVDAKWAVPHFEKMLYDNGLLLQLYSEVLAKDRFERIAGRTEVLTPERRMLFLRTVAKTAEYLLREMEDPQGGFYAAQDADSEGEEGKFFAFDLKDLAEILPPEETEAFSLRYGVTAGGNFEHGKSVLAQAMAESEVARKIGITDVDARTLIATAERKVFTARESRVKPGLDDKILTSWNGLAISGLIWASAALEHAGTDLANIEYSTLGGRARASAEKTFERFVTLPVSSTSPLASTLPTTIQKSTPKGTGFLDDYAFFARAALDLHRFGTKTIGSHALSEWAAIYMNRVIDSFSDPSGDPGYFFTAKDHEVLLQRPKSLYDQAIPSGTAVACANLIALSELLEPGDKYPIEDIQAFGAEARTQLVKLIPHLEKSAYGHGELASALHLAEKGMRIYAGLRAVDAVMSDRDFAPFAEHGVFKGQMGEFKVCTRGTCRGFDTLEAWAKA